MSQSSPNDKRDEDSGCEAHGILSCEMCGSTKPLSSAELDALEKDWATSMVKRPYTRLIAQARRALSLKSDLAEVTEVCDTEIWQRMKLEAAQSSTSSASSIEPIVESGSRYVTPHHEAEVRKHWEYLVRKWSEAPFRTDTSQEIANVINDAINLSRGVRRYMTVMPSATGAAIPEGKHGEVIHLPDGLHRDTQNLVMLFAGAMAYKLNKAQEKYGYDNGWKGSDWEQECRDRLHEHLAKGDPRDVANYCAFMWHHGWATTAPDTVAMPKAWVEAAKCDNCGGQGWKAIQVEAGVFEQEQCQWCFERWLALGQPSQSDIDCSSNEPQK